MKNTTIYFSFVLILSFTNLALSETSGKNLKFLLNSIDLKSKEFTINQAENAWQEAMNNLVVKSIEINNRTKEKIKALGPIMYKTNSELANIQNIHTYRERIKQYKMIKKEHYDSLDVLLRNTNTAIGKTENTNKRLAGGNQYYEERLELFYLYDLDNYYKFIASHHNKFGFKGEKMSLNGDNRREQYAILLNKVIESKANINQIFKFKSNLLKDRMDELKDWVEKQ